MPLEGTAIVVVEDEAIVAEEIRDHLNRAGARVHVVDTGRGAIDAAREHRPHVTLMDIRLKGPMTGIEAAEKIRGELDIPIIFVTAHSDWATVMRAKHEEPFDFMFKPFHGRDLVASVQKALRMRELEAQAKRHEEAEQPKIVGIAEEIAELVAEVTGRLDQLLAHLDTDRASRAQLASIQAAGTKAVRLAGELRRRAGASPEDEPPTVASETVLVVDDDGAVRKLLAMGLRHRGYEVLEAASAEDALRVYRACAACQTPVRLVVTDLVLPGIDGTELAGHLRSLDPALQVLFMSGFREDPPAGAGASPADFMPKPMLLKDFLGKVREMLDRPIGNA